MLLCLSLSLSLSHTDIFTRSHSTLVSFMSLIFISNFLQEVPLMTTPLTGPQGAAVRLSWQPQTGKGTTQPIGARVISSDHQPQTWAPSHTVHFHIVEGLHPSLSPFYSHGIFFPCKYWSCRTSEISLSYKMGNCGHYIAEWEPSKLDLLTWISKILFFFNLKLNVSPLIDAVH